MPLITMLLSSILGISILMNMVLTPFQKIESEEESTLTTITIELPVSGDEEFTAMMQRYTAYNHWANQQMADWLRSASEEDLNQEIESSFKSLQETVLHIWKAEYLWLQTVKGEASDNSPARDFSGNKNDLLEGWLRASENFHNHVQIMSSKDLQAKRPRSKGDGFILIADMIQHCMNHSTYHRGQLITMGRQAGLKDPPRTDFIYFVSLQGQ